MKIESPYKNLSISERIKKILNNETFRQFCLYYKQKNKDFEKNFKVAEKIATIDISNIKIDYDKLYLRTYFSVEDVKKNMLEFYQYLDNLSNDNSNLSNIVKNHIQFAKYYTKSNNISHSYCSSSIDKNGNIKKEIYINLEGRVGDVSNSIHEFCHSLSQGFINCKHPKDIKMLEVAPVILDFISNYYLAQQYPKLKKNFSDNLLFYNVQNVMKAREVLFEGLTIKLMLNEITIQEIESKYGKFLLRIPLKLLENCIESIETENFAYMYESQYLILPVIASNVLEIYKTNPKDAVDLFKNILKNDTNLTMEETIKNLGFASEISLINDYIKNFHSKVNYLSKFEDLTK